METVKGFDLKPFDLMLTSMMAAGNFAASMYIAPVLTTFIPHALAGAILMVPLNLFLAYSVWAITRKNVFTMYFFVYGLLTMPTTVWGSTPGIFKPLLGIAIGLSLDLMAFKLRPEGKVAKPLMALIFPIIWWSLTGGTWVLTGLPAVQIFQAMLTSVPALGPIASQGFAATFALIALMTIPSSVVAVYSAVSLSKRVGQIVTIPRLKIAKEEVSSGKCS